MDVITNTLIMLANGIPGLVVAGVTMILMLLALIRKEAGMMLFASLLVVPFAYALGGWSGLGLFVRLLPLFSLVSAFAIGRDDPIFAWSLPMPVFGYLIYILFKILSSGYVGINSTYIY
jgi:hypothetical protein